MSCGTAWSRCYRCGSGGSGIRGGSCCTDREVLCGILYVLQTSIQWEHLSQELGFGSGMTCWRQLRDWNEAGVWQRLHEVLLAELNAAARLDWSTCVVDSSHVRAVKRGSTWGRRWPTEGGPGRTRRAHRRPRHPARRPDDRWQPQRRHSAPAAARRRRAGARQGRTSTPQARLPVRRLRLRPRRLPGPGPRPRHSSRHRPTRNPARDRPGHLPVGSRANHRLATWPGSEAGSGDRFDLPHLSVDVKSDLPRFVIARSWY